jgi:uncharacterized protein YkwD
MRLLRPTRLLSIVVIFITVALASSMFVNTSSATAATSTRSNARAGSVASIPGLYDAQIVHYTNQARAAHHLRPLIPRACVDGYAERWTVTMARYSNFSHQRLMPILRGCHRSAAAENIATGTRGLSARTFVQMWLRSPGHRHNMLNPKYRYIGVAAWRSAGTGRIYATQDFTN